MNLPTIAVNGRRLRDLTAAAIRILDGANDPPVVFRRGDAWVRLRFDDDEPRIEAMTSAALKGRLERIADWVVIKEGGEMAPVDPPANMVADLMALPEVPAPPLDRIVNAPVFGADGSLRIEPGYHEASRSYLWLRPGGLDVEEVSAAPTTSEVEVARSLILDDLLGDFPLASDADRAHAVALGLQPFVRELIPGSTPLFLVEAPEPGTGKTLLVDVLLSAALGGEVEKTAEGRDDDEWRKRVTAMLIRGAGAVVIDNVRRRLDTASLAAALTTGRWTDRILGRSEMVTLPVRNVWVATANNPALSSEMTRRSVRIRLDSGLEQPWMRRGFKHHLPEWAHEQRADLVWAYCTLTRAWIAAGCPAGERIIGSFEGWSRVIGGILDVAGIPGFLGNLDEHYAAADAEKLSLAGFVEAWWAERGEKSSGVSELWWLADDFDLVGDSGSDRARRTRFGRFLAGLRGRHVGDYVVIDAGISHGSAQWQLHKSEASR